MVGENVLISTAKKYIISIFICLLLSWIAGFIWFGHYINNFKDNKDMFTDAIVVLTGGRNRIATAVNLLNDNKAEHLFISGVRKNIKLNDIINNGKMKIKNTQKVELGYLATNTVENASEIKDWLINNKITSVRLITSNYHMPRSMAEISAYNLKLQIIATPVYSEKVAYNWWHSWGTFKLIFCEYNKYLIVIIRNILLPKGN